MKNIYRYALITICAVVASGAAGWTAFSLFSGDAQINSAALQNVAAAPLLSPAAAVMEQETQEFSEEVVGVDTRLIYQYHYLQDGRIESNAEEAPYFLIGLTHSELAERLEGWEIMSFSQETVLLQKIINAKSTANYTLGIHEGYVAVFYDEEVNGSRVKEVTDMPVNALSGDEVVRLSAGIRIIGDDELAKVLEDYGS